MPTILSQFKADIKTAIGSDVKVMVNRANGQHLDGYVHGKKVLQELTDDNIQSYEYSIYTSDEYRVMVPNVTATYENNYWDGLVAKWYLQYLPGCCGVCLSYHANVSPKFKGKKLGVRCRIFREDIARAQGFSTLLSTATIRNAAQNKIMERTGAEEVYRFNNARSNNDVAISVKDLRDRKVKRLVSVAA